MLPHAADQALHLFIHCPFHISLTQLSSSSLIVSTPSFPFISPLSPCHCIAKLARSAVTHLQMHACKWGHRLSQPNAVAPVLPRAAGTPFISTHVVAMYCHCCNNKDCHCCRYHCCLLIASTCYYHCCHATDLQLIGTLAATTHSTLNL